MEIKYIFLAVAIIIAAYLFLTKDSRAAKKALRRQQEQWALEDADPEVHTSLRVIYESMGIIAKTRKFETARSRYELTVGMLERILDKYPHRTDWQEQLNYLQTECVENILGELVEERLAKHLDKASVAKTVASQISNLNKALLELREIRGLSYFNTAWIDEKCAMVEELIHTTELGKLFEKAERHEFKEEWKKAISAYQDVLFFLRNDNIDDEEQEDLFKYLDNKIIELKNITTNKKANYIPNDSVH